MRLRPFRQAFLRQRCMAFSHPGFPGSRVDVVYDQVDVPLCKELKAGSFGQGPSAAWCEPVPARLSDRSASGHNNKCWKRCIPVIPVSKASGSPIRNHGLSGYILTRKRIHRFPYAFPDGQKQTNSAFGASVHQKSKEEFFFGKKHGQQGFL